MGRIVQQQNLSLNMSLLLFTLLSTSLAVPAPCPPMPPMDCGEGMTNCPGPIDPMGCMMPDSCVAEGDACPFHCPPMPPMECGEGSGVMVRPANHSSVGMEPAMHGAYARACAGACARNARLQPRETGRPVLQIGKYKLTRVHGPSRAQHHQCRGIDE